MGRGLAGGYVNAGHQVILGSRSAQRAQNAALQIGGDVCGKPLQETVQDADLLVIAIPFSAVAGLVKEVSDQLSGKIVVDITNPFGGVPPGQVSGIEFNARGAASARWVAAYKTTFWKTLDTSRHAEGTRLDVFVCSDDLSAKQTVSELIEQTGFRAVDCGRLENARTLDLMVPLMLELDARHVNQSTSSWKFLD